jgi:NAD(P)-dependent dehydrogenase (short-subunit alcohol dehydrogenase family)
MKRVCLITGALGRLGQAFCDAYADEYEIVGVYCNSTPKAAERPETVVDPLDLDRRTAARNAGPFLIKADLTADWELERVVELALARHDRIDLLINGAAVWTTGFSLADESRMGEFERLMSLNMLVPMKLAALIAKHFWRKEKKDGNTIWRRNAVNVSSTAGLQVAAKSQDRFYSVAKGALNHLTAHMAHDYAPLGIRVNAVAPTSFPRVIGAADVVKAIVGIDRGTCNGCVTVVDEHGTRIHK